MDRLFDWSGSDSPRTYSEEDGKVSVSQDGQKEEVPCSFEEIAEYLRNEQNECYENNERLAQIRQSM